MATIFSKSDEVSEEREVARIYVTVGVYTHPVRRGCQGERWIRGKGFEDHVPGERGGDAATKGDDDVSRRESKRDANDSARMFEEVRRATRGKRGFRDEKEKEEEEEEEGAGERRG